MSDQQSTAGRSLADVRIDYAAGSLEDTAPKDPFELFTAWMDAAFSRQDIHGDLPEPTATVLSTVALGADGRPIPRSRTVLLKSADASGFVFYTNRDSAKGQELVAHADASLLLPWYPLQRQVRIEGSVTQVSDEQSDAYFATRPRGSQLSAWASRQSWPVCSREDLDTSLRRVHERFADEEVPRPPHWGGYRLVPYRFEFWQGRRDRLHDRFAYDLDADRGWRIHRLQP